MIGVRAMLDANVLYPAPLRDLLIQLAVTGLFEAKWTADIHREWMESLLRNEPSRHRANLERTRDLMNRAVRDCLIIEYELLIPGLSLPDPADRHVLAAAIVGQCDVIVTKNLADFPAPVLQSYNIVALHPDRFLSILLAARPDSFCEGLRKLRGRLKNPPFTVDEYLATLIRQGLAQTVTALGSYHEWL